MIWRSDPDRAMTPGWLRDAVALIPRWTLILLTVVTALAVFGAALVGGIALGAGAGERITTRHG